MAALKGTCARHSETSPESGVVGARGLAPPSPTFKSSGSLSRLLGQERQHGAREGDGTTVHVARTERSELLVPATIIERWRARR